MILADRAAEHAEAAAGEGRAAAALVRAAAPPADLGGDRRRGLTDPVWFMIADWFAIYLVAKGYSLEETAAGFWVPFLAADLGNFFGGGFSSWLIRRGWPVGRARRLGDRGRGAGRPRPHPGGVRLELRGPPRVLRRGHVLLRGDVDHGHSRCPPTSTRAARSPRSPGCRARPPASARSARRYLIGVVADRFSFTPILVVASVVPFTGAVLVLLLVRNTAQSGRGCAQGHMKRPRVARPLRRDALPLVLRPAARAPPRPRLRLDPRRRPARDAAPAPPPGRRRRARDDVGQPAVRGGAPVPRAPAAPRGALRRRGEGALRAAALRAARDRERSRADGPPASRSWRSPSS